MKYLNIKKVGLNASFMHDVYYRTLKASWLNFFFVAGAVYILINLIFACIYYISPAEIANVSSHSLWEHFVFSFQTSTTIGYGYFLPKSDTAHALVILDATIGIFYVAIITGLAFAKFSRPHAKVLFSNKVIFTMFDNRPAIMFRIANGRDTHIVDAKVKVAVLLPYESQEGLKMRRYYNLELLSDSNPTFALSWTVIYQIKENCPLHGLTLEEIKNLNALFTVSFTGIDDVISQNIHANNIFMCDTFHKAKKFKDILNTDEIRYTLDMTNFHEIE